MKLTLNTQILIGALIGIAIGIFLHPIGHNLPLYTQSIFILDLMGSIFVNLLKMILIPLVFASICVGIANLKAHAQMNRVWKLTLLFFLSTTVISVALALTAVNIFKPGVGLEMELFKEFMSSFQGEKLTFMEFIQKFISGLFMNPFKAMASGEVLPTVIFAIFLGIALIKLGDKSKVILNALNEFFEVIMLLVQWIMKIAPLGIMALIAKLVATQNLELFQSLGKFVCVVLGTTLFHGVVVLPSILYSLTGVSPIKYFLAMRDALITAFSTSSSSATMPITLRCVEQNLKVDKNIANFVVPLGTTVNMDGTAIYEATAALFIANLAGIELNLIQQLIVFFTSMVAAIGAPGIPSAGMVTMIMVLQSVGLPIEAIAILLPIDRPLDAVRTMVNVEGDAVGSVIVQKFTTKS